MRLETLLRALTLVRKKIVQADREAANWLAERDRRRRQQALFLAGIVRITGSQRAAAAATGISQSVISRTINPDGHKQKREKMRKTRPYPVDNASDATNQNVASPDEPTNVVPLRQRRPDWKPREPRRPEIRKWWQQYLSWTRSAKLTARQLIFNSEGALPDEAFYPNDDRRPDGKGAVGQQEGVA